MKFVLLVATALSVASAAVHRAPATPVGWEQSEILALADSQTTFVLSLKETGMDTIKQLALAVSDPKSASYGEYLSSAQIAAATAPLPETVDAVTGWLDAKGIDYTVTGSRVHVVCSIEQAEGLMNSKFVMLTNRETKQTVLRATDYTLPDSVETAVDAVFGLHGLPLPVKMPPQPAQPASVTPDVLTSTYKVSGVTPKGGDNNRQAVAEFQGQYMNSTDLKVFFKTYVSKYTEGKDDVVSKFVGDQNKQEGQTEASLDIQYMMGVNPGIKSEFWLYNSMDFCGDLANWTAAILADDSAPLVHSVSYGWQGNLSQIQCEDSKVQVVDANFAKLAAKGITIIFASGDSGSGYSPGGDPQQCMKAGMKDVSLEGTKSRTIEAEEQMQCCEMAQGNGVQGWTFTPGSPAPPQAGPCTGTTGVAMTGQTRLKFRMSSAMQCCDIASHERDVKGWTFSSLGNGEGECELFDEVTSNSTNKTAISGVPPPRPPPGKCDLFSAVTGKGAKTGATSGEASNKVKLWPSWPASSPWVTAVGSTRFVGQKVGAEEMATDQFGSGGGFSDMFDTTKDATWQAAATKKYLASAPMLPPSSSFPAAGRGTPDVSALGEGYMVYINGRVEPVGGTSASAPAFAGLVSLLNEARLGKGMKPMGFLNQWIYQNTDAFTDITKGNNRIGRGTFTLPYGFNCTAGWDPVSGVGTPVFDKMLAAALKN